MTNTWCHHIDSEKAALEELRLIRCCLERMLRHVSKESLFVDYQNEKASGDQRCGYCGGGN